MSRILIKQHDTMDCGAACLASIAAHYRLFMPIARIRQLIQTDQKGTSALGMIEGAEKMGFDAKGVRGDEGSLNEVPLPCIAHISIEDKFDHYVVIYAVDKSTISLMDPGSGTLEKLSRKKFSKLWSGVLLLLAPSEGRFIAENLKVSNYMRFWELVKPHKSILLQAVIGAMFYTLLGLSTSIYIQKLTDHVLVNGNKNLLHLMGIIMLVFLLVQIVLGVSKSMLSLKTAQLIDARLILGYYKHLLSLPQQFFDNMRVGEILSRVNDAVKIRAFINDISIQLVVNAFIVVFSFALMFTYYWKLALIVLTVIPLYLAVYFLVNYLNKKYERRLMESSADLESQLVESLSTVATIKSFGIEQMANFKTETSFVNLLDQVYISGKTSIFSATATESIARGFTLAMLWIGAAYVIERNISAGELMSFYALSAYFTGPLTSLVGSNKTLQNALIASDRLFEIMDLQREDQSHSTDISPNQIGDIHFRNVHFRYGSRTEVFQGLSLTFKQGEMSAIVGESGSGKSTVFSLLKGLYPLQGGNIEIGELDMRYISTKSLRKCMGVVPQKIDLFSGSILENIALGDFNPDFNKVLQISKDLGIYDFIQSLPDGFNSYIGENGAQLSGGQRQRLAIGRALYRDPDILLLDEATSALDSESEQYVQDCLYRLRRKGKTIIIVAHRMSTIKNADRVFLMHEGRIVESGTHKELISLKGKYHHLHEKQYQV